MSVSTKTAEKLKQKKFDLSDFLPYLNDLVKKTEVWQAEKLSDPTQSTIATRSPENIQLKRYGSISDEEKFDARHLLDYKISALISEAESGKTLFMHHLANKLANKCINGLSTKIPLYVRIGSYNDEMSLKDLAVHSLNTANFQIEPDDFKLENHNIVFLLDGFDECNIHFRMNLAQEILSLRRYNNVTTIIATREKNLQLLDGVPKYTIIKSAEIEEQYPENKDAYQPKSKIARIENRIAHYEAKYKNNPQSHITNLDCIRALHCEIAFGIVRAGNPLCPETFEKITDALLVDFKKRGLISEVSRLDFVNELRQFGFLAIEKIEVYFKSREVMNYYAALCLSQYPDEIIKGTLKKIKWWEEPFVYFSGLVDDSTQIIQALMPNLKLAAEALAESRTCNDKIRTKIIQTLTENIHSKISDTRTISMDLLLKIPNAVDGEFFNNLFSDSPYTDVRLSALEQMIKLNPENAEKLIPELKNIREKHSKKITSPILQNNLLDPNEKDIFSSTVQEYISNGKITNLPPEIINHPHFVEIFFASLESQYMLGLTPSKESLSPFIREGNLILDERIAKKLLEFIHLFDRDTGTWIIRSIEKSDFKNRQLFLKEWSEAMIKTERLKPIIIEINKALKLSDESGSDKLVILLRALASLGTAKEEKIVLSLLDSNRKKNSEIVTRALECMSIFGSMKSLKIIKEIYKEALSYPDSDSIMNLCRHAFENIVRRRGYSRVIDHRDLERNMVFRLKNVITRYL